MDYGVALGRRFRSLKFWMILRSFGREGIEKLLRAHIAWAQELATWITADERFEVSAPHPFSVVCFRYKGTDEDNRALLEKVNATGQAYITHTELEGKVVLRIALAHLSATREDVQAVWELVQQCAKA